MTTSNTLAHVPPANFGGAPHTEPATPAELGVAALGKVDSGNVSQKDASDQKVRLGLLEPTLIY